MKKHIHFSQNLKKYIAFSLAIVLIGIACNVIFGSHLDIQFTGGTIVSYSYSGDVEEAELKDYIQEITKDTVTMQISESLVASEKSNSLVTIQFSGNKTISTEEQKNITAKLQEKYADNNFALSESSSVEASMGLKFFLKCLVAIGIAALLMVVYVAIRFRKIGGWSAGAMGLVALVHDIVMVYFAFVILRFPIDSNFIAVVLMIIGYSLNDTIVIYDRVRENRKLMGRNATYAEVFDLSANQMIKRTILTSLTTLVAIASVYVVAFIYHIESVKTFALPMMIGIVFGCYSSLCIAGPLWVAWQNRKAAKK